MTDDRDTAALQFAAGLGAAMASANYPVTMVRETMVTASRAYGLDNQYLALPNYVQVGYSGSGRLLVPGSLGLMGSTQMMGTDSTAAFTATLIAMISIALGVLAGLLLWRVIRQFGPSDDPRLFRA